jgi:hypothetical protein
MNKNILLEDELKRLRELMGTSSSNVVTIGFKNLNNEKNKILEMHEIAKSKENIIFEQNIENNEEPIDQEISDEEYESEEFLEFLKSAFKKGFENQTQVNESKKNINEQTSLSFLGNRFCYSNKGLCGALKKFNSWVRNIDINFDFGWLDGLAIKMGPDNFFKKIKDLYKKWRHNRRKYKKKRFVKTWVDAKGEGAFKGSRFRVGIRKYVPLGKGEPGAEKTMYSDSRGEVFEFQEYIKTPEEEWDKFLTNNEQSMLGLMDSTSIDNWNTIKVDKDNKKFAVYALEYFLRQQPKIGYTEILVGENQNAIKDIVDPTKKDIPDEPKNDLVTLNIPGNFDASNLFQDNHWEIEYAPDFVKMVNTIADGIVDQMETMDPKLKWKAYLQELYLYSSCSRYRNSKGAADLSFQELAKRRLETGRDYIIETFEKIGVIIDNSTVITLDYMAKKSDKVPFGNGDGSSGPNPPKNDGGFVPLGDYPMTSGCDKFADECEVDGKTVERDELGEPLASKADYEKFKFVKGYMNIVLNGEVPKPPLPEPKTKDTPPDVVEIPTALYPITFLKPPKGAGRIGIPGMELKLKLKLSGGLTAFSPQKKGKTKTCPEAYGNKVRK